MDEILKKFAGELTKIDHPWAIQYLERTDGAAELISQLLARFEPKAVCVPKPERDEQRAWEICGLYYLNIGRLHEALGIFEALYAHMLSGQRDLGKWVHKGMPLVFISQCHMNLGHPWLAKRYAMLTLVEDAIRDRGVIDIKISGIYFRLVWLLGMAGPLLEEYARYFFKIFCAQPARSMHPEWVLLEADDHWLVEYPAPEECLYYRANSHLLAQLAGEMGDGGGEALEGIARHALGCIPGFRTTRRQRSYSTDYDVVCGVDGLLLDFRSELGRYILCECKDWQSPADLTSVAKFSRVLESTKCRAGFLFSKKGVTGADKTTDGAREILKVFQDRGIAIMVIDLADIGEVIKGANLVSILRRRYERVRMDLR